MSKGSWPIVALGELLESIEAGSSFRCRETPPEDGEVGVAKVSAVSWGRYDEQESKTCLDPSRINTALLIRKGDFLISRANTVELVGACVIAEQVRKQVMLSDKTLRIQFKDPSLKPWVLHFLRSRSGREQIEALCTGNQESMRNISQRSLRMIGLPLAPPGQRQEILAFIEEQLSRADATSKTLQAIQSKLKQARASILKAAVEGRLVGAKPILHDGQLEGENLTSIEVGDADRSSTAGKLRKKKASLSVPADVACAPLPDGWRWTTIDQESIFLKYGTSAKCGKDPDGVPVVRMGNIQDGAIVMDSIKYLPFDHAEFPDQLLTRGELLFNRTNSSDLVGKTAVFHGNQLHACASYIIRVKLKDTVLPELVAYNLNGPSGRAWAQSVASQQVGQANINSQKLRAFYFAIPPFDVQQRIIAEVERRFSVLDQVEATVNASLRRCGQLRQAVLKRAFGG